MAGGAAPLICVHPTSTDLSYPLLALAREAADRGLHGIYLSEHTHFPLDVDRSAYPLAHLKDVPERYKRLFDPYLMLSAIAQVTDLELGTSVVLPLERDPIALAKVVATLDWLSGGRVVLGVGYGWNRAELANHGVDPASRAARLAEVVGVMKALWCDEVATFSGEHVRLSPSLAWPKPVRQPHPPILLGARGTDRNFERIAAWGDGWITMEYQMLEGRFASQLDRLRSVWTDAGRAGEPIVVAQVMPGPRDELRRMYDRCQEIGVSRLNVVLEDHPADVVLPIMDDLVAAAEA